jgi:membrane protease YdiL (CAAX protease family)
MQTPDSSPEQRPPLATHPSPLTKTRDTAALTFALLFPVVMAWVYFVEIGDAGGGANPALVAAFTIGKLIQFPFPAVYVWWFERDRLEPRWPTTRGLGLGVGFALVVDAAMLALYLGWLRPSGLADAAPERIWHRVVGFGAGTPARYVLLAGFICVLHALLEEYYWRWFVFGWLKRYLSVGGAIAVSSVGFTLHHVVVLGVFFPGRFWALAVPFAACTGVGGAVWAWIYHRSGSLYAAWASHFLIDAGIMVVGYLMLAPYWPG